MDNPLSYLSEQLNQWRQEGTYQRLRVLQSESAAHSRFDGKEVINLASNNYLGLTTHPKLREAAPSEANEFRFRQSLQQSGKSTQKACKRPHQRA